MFVQCGILHASSVRSVCIATSVVPTFEVVKEAVGRIIEDRLDERCDELQDDIVLLGGGQPRDFVGGEDLFPLRDEAKKFYR